MSEEFNNNTQQMMKAPMDTQPQYGLNPYMQPYGGKPPKGDGTGFGVASLVLGIASVFLFGCCVNYITAVLAIIFGVVQMVKNRSKSMAVAGIVTACVSILLGTFMWIGVAVNMNGRSAEEIYDDIYNDFYDYYEDQYPLNDYIDEL